MNPIQFKRTLCNLVNNSIEATDSNGIVTIHVTPEECGIKLSIHDNGKGIAAHPDFLFQRGFTTKAKGNGLGLSSAKEFVESLGGKILVENLNQGTSVSLTIPSFPKNQFPSVPPENHQIVLIDDDPLVRFNWKRQGRECGITVSCFESFKEFSQRINSFELETPVYIDSQLGSERGELLSEELSSFGYKNIYLTTGSPKRSLLSTKWVSDIVGKGFESAVLSRYQL